MIGGAHYPSYKDLDPFIDVERLRSLDGYIGDKLRRRIAQEAADTAFYTGPFQLGENSARVPGSRMVYLSRSQREDNYYDLDDPAAWQRSEEAAEFGPLMDFIATLPFRATGRMLIIYDDNGRAVTAHRDHDSPEPGAVPRVRVVPHELRQAVLHAQRGHGREAVRAVARRVVRYRQPIPRRGR
jgi:hypothetical protein